jgi:pimeloyl-ACP methyl ester carboxylesterase
MTILAWQEGGAPAGRAVLLLHAWASDGARDWDATGWVDAFGAAGRRVLVPDLPGHAGSADVLLPPDAQPAAWTASVILADLERLRVAELDAVGFAEGCVVAGHLAVRAPRQVGGLVLIAADDRATPHGTEIAGGLRSAAGRVWHPEAAERVAEARRDRRHHLPTLAQWAQEAAWPAVPRLGSLRTPVLLANGTDDELRERAPGIAQLLHDAHLATVPGAGRTALEAPELRRAAVDFLNARITTDAAT